MEIKRTYPALTSNLDMLEVIGESGISVRSIMDGDWVNFVFFILRVGLEWDGAERVGAKWAGSECGGMDRLNVLGVGGAFDVMIILGVVISLNGCHCQ